MGEACDPVVYYKRVREFMGGWRNNPRLPNGLGYGSHGRKEFYGETGVRRRRDALHDMRCLISLSFSPLFLSSPKRPHTHTQPQ